MLQSLVAVYLLSFIPAVGSAQIPDVFNNLQVLQKDISKAELIGRKPKHTSIPGFHKVISKRI